MVFRTFGGLLSFSVLPFSSTLLGAQLGALRHLFVKPPKVYHPCGALIPCQIRGATTVVVLQVFLSSLFTVSCPVKRASEALEEVPGCLGVLRRVAPTSHPVNTELEPVKFFFIMASSPGFPRPRFGAW